MKTASLTRRMGLRSTDRRKTVCGVPIIGLCLVLSGGFAPQGSAQTLPIFYDFSDPPSDLTYYDPLGNGAIDATAGICSLSAGPSPLPEVSPAILGVERLDVTWTECEISVDVSGWMVGERVNTWLAILTGASANPDGTRNGMALGFMPNYTPELTNTTFVPFPNLGFDKIVGSSPTSGGEGIVDLSAITLDPADWYRLVVRVESNSMTGELYRRDDLAAPLATTSIPLGEPLTPGGFIVVAVDRAGFAGIVHNGVTAEFDNLFATQGKAEPDLTIEPAVILTWPVWTAGFTLESADSVDGPWSPTGATATLTDEGNVVSVKTAGHGQYFRLVR